MIKHSDTHANQKNFSDVVKMETYFAQEKKHIWKKMVKIEKIKKENLSQKNFLLCRGIRAN